MPHEPAAESPLDFTLLSAAVESASRQCRELLGEYLATTPVAAPVRDPLGIATSFQHFLLQLAQNPLPLWQAQWRAWEEGMAAWQRALEKAAGHGEATKPSTDRRFKDAEWETNPLYNFIRETWSIFATSLTQLATDTSGLDEKDAQKIAFYTRQYVDAISPSNFALTNPEVMRATIESGGKNLVEGLKHFLEDFDPATGTLRTKMVDDSNFELGRNVAVTPGSVVFQNDLMQLLQFAPSTTKARRRPLLMIPPWINKYYVLDLQPKNSFIKWAVDQGHTVFVISWVNPDERLREKDFEDYLLEGPVAALDAIEQATGERAVNVIGYCLGGTLLGATLAWLKARRDSRVKSATFFTAMLDFTEPGDLGVFIDEQQISNLEQDMATRGYLDGKEMATTFNLLRANDLIWSFVINNYLLGKEPAPFDLLYWNSDSTRMPARMHSTYLRKMYMQNLLREPGGLTLAGTPIDLHTIDIPVCFVSAVEDHIAPWKSTFMGAQLPSGPVTFLLGKAGHIAGIVNPPGPRAYGHYSGPDPRGLDADTWLAQASARDGSWWLTWDEWVSEFSGGEVVARKPGEGALPRLEAAPGSYVRNRLK